MAAAKSGVVYCGSMGDWPLIDDATRMDGVARLIGAGVPVMVGTGAINTACAEAHAEHAARVGVDTMVREGFVDDGARGVITGIGNVLPREVLHLMALSRKAAEGDARARHAAQELAMALQVLSSFDEGVDLVLYYKHFLTLLGENEYALNIHPTDRLSSALAGYAEMQFALFRRWYADWSQRLDSDLA